jgi:plastocyanin
MLPARTDGNGAVERPFNWRGRGDGYPDATHAHRKEPDIAMKKAVVLVIPLVLILALAIAGCGKSPGNGGGGGDEYTSPDVTMGQSDFDHHKLTVAPGTTVNFKTDTSGSTHILCIGENGACQSGAQGPSELTAANGMQVDPGQTKSVKFDTAGTYKIACTVHPNMNLTITVQ